MGGGPMGWGSHGVADLDAHHVEVLVHRAPRRRVVVPPKGGEQAAIEATELDARHQVQDVPHVAAKFLDTCCAATSSGDGEMATSDEGVVDSASRAFNLAISANRAASRSAAAFPVAALSTVAFSSGTLSAAFFSAAAAVVRDRMPRADACTRVAAQ